jgi:hypothetical protein
MPDDLVQQWGKKAEEALRLPCEPLTPYAVGFRYPGEDAAQGRVPQLC